MAQFARPDADTATGSWATTPLWSKVDDDSPGDDVVITSDAVGNNTDTSIANLRLSDVTDPEVSTSHVLRVRWSNSDPSRGLAGNVRLRQGTTQIALLNVAGLGAEAEDTLTLSAGQADSITDYTDLNVEIWGRGTSGGPGRSLIVELVQLEVPDVGQTFFETLAAGMPVVAGIATEVNPPEPTVAVPDADNAIGQWTPTPLWSKVDEDPPGDDVEITSDTVQGTDTSKAELGLSDVADPEVSTGHVLRVRWRKSQGESNTVTGRLRLLQGAVTVIAETSVNDVGLAEQEDTYTLTAEEADSITNYANLNIQVWASVSGGLGLEGLAVELVRFEVPAAEGGQTFFEALPATSIFTAQFVRQAGKPLSATSPFTSAFQRSVGKPVPASSAFGPGVIKAPRKPIAATSVFTPSLATASLVAQLLEAATALTPAISRSTGKTLASSLVAGVELVRGMGKPIEATTTLTPAFVRSMGKTLGVPSTFDAELTRALAETLGASSAFDPALIKSMEEALPVVMSATPGLTKGVGKTVSATSVFVADELKQMSKALIATSALGPAMVRQVGKTLPVDSSFAPTLSSLQVLGVALDVVSTFAPALTRVTGKSLEATSTLAAGVVKSVGKAIAAGTALSPTILKTVGKRLLADSPLSASLITSSTFAKQLAATSAFTPEVLRESVVGVILAAASPFVADIAPLIGKRLEATSPLLTSISTGKDLARALGVSSVFTATVQTAPDITVGWVVSPGGEDVWVLVTVDGETWLLSVGGTDAWSDEAGASDSWQVSPGGTGGF